MSISPIDKEYYKILRSSVTEFLISSRDHYVNPGSLILDIAPEKHNQASSIFNHSKTQTFDIDPKSGADYVGDICKLNPLIPHSSYDCIVCTEVLEHVFNPFRATEEIWRLLKPNGIALITTPFNFRIHGPAPDCWRFTEKGLRTLLKRFKIESLTQIDSERYLMPIHYRVVARKILGS